MSKVTYFEVIVEDTDRAIAFYTDIFGWEIKKADMPTMDYWYIQTTPLQTPGAINGGLRKEMGIDKKERTVSVNGYVCTIEIEHIDEITLKIMQKGGKIMQPKMLIPGLGWQAYCLDSEGNAFNILQRESGIL